MNVFSYYRQQLPPVERRLYDAALAGIQNWERNIRFCAGTETVNTQRVVYALRFDNPEVISVHPTQPGSLSCTQRNGQNHYLFTPRYVFTPEQAQERMHRVRALTAPILANVKGRSDLEITKYLHDWLVIRDRYGYKEGEQDLSYSMLGAFLNNTCVCEGFSKAFKYLCDQARVRCMAVTGYSLGPTRELSGAHCWNLAVVDGVPYQIDVTFDNHDQIADGGTCSHAYFLLSTRLMRINHEFITGFTVPNCPMEHSVLQIIRNPAALLALLRREFQRRALYTEFRVGEGLSGNALMHEAFSAMGPQDAMMRSRMGNYYTLGEGRTILVLWK